MANTSAAKNTAAPDSNRVATGWQARLSQQPQHLALAYWRSLYYFTLYRLIAGGILLLTYIFLGTRVSFGQMVPHLFVLANVGYLLVAGAALVAVHTRWPRYELQLTGQVISDIFFITLLMFASGGASSGLGLLLLISLAASSLTARGRLSMFHAAVATIAILLQQIYVGLTEDRGTEYTQAALLSIAYFAIAALAYTLGKRLTASEEVAKQQSADLANLDEINRLVIKDMQDGVLVIDADGQIRQCNGQAERLLSIHQNPALSLAEHSPELAQRVAEWRENGDISVLPLRARDGNRTYRVRFIPIGEGAQSGAVIFLEDLSRLQAQAQQIKLAALGRLTANIAHEIRNPLSSIGHATQLLQEDEQLDATQKRLLEIIRDNTFRLDRMVQDILQLNRKDRGQSEPIQLTDFLQKFQDEFCRSENIALESLRIDAPEKLRITFDRYHLHQVVWNLCRNAWRHSKQQAGSVRLVASRAHAENVVQLDVIDDGPGVAHDMQAQLFEPFFTTESTGTGLGLYIARQLAEANGATLDLIEVAPGGQFRICGKGVAN